VRQYVIKVKHETPEIGNLNKNLTSFVNQIRELVSSLKTFSGSTPKVGPTSLIGETNLKDFNKFYLPSNFTKLTTRPLRELSGNFRFVNYEIMELNKQTSSASRMSKLLANNVNEFGSNLVGYIMAFLGASFTFSFLAISIEKNLEQFDRLAEASRKLSSLDVEISPDAYENLQKQLEKLSENLNVSFYDISQVADNVSFASEDLGQAFDRMRLAAAIAKASGMDMKRASQYIVGALEGDARSIKALRRYLGMEEGELLDPSKMWKKISKGMLANDVQLEEIVRNQKIKLSYLWSYVDDTTDNLSLAFYSFIGKLSDAIFGFGKSANTFQKFMRGAIGGLGSGLLILSKGVSSIGQFGLAVFGLIELGKVLSSLWGSVSIAIASITSLSGALGMLAAGGVVGVALLGLGFAIKKVGDLANSTARKMEAMRVATNLWLSSIINGSRDINDFMKKISETKLTGEKEGEINPEFQKTEGETLTGISINPIKVKLPYQFNLSETEEWKNIQNAVEKYKQEYKKLGYVTTQTASEVQKIIEDNINTIIEKYKVAKDDQKKLDQLKKYLYQFLSTSIQLEDLSEKANESSKAVDEAKKRLQNAMNALNGLLDLNQKYAKYTGNTLGASYWQTFKQSLQMMKQFFTKEGMEALKELQKINPALYKQLAPTKYKFTTIMKGMWLDSLNYWQKIRISFKGGLQSISEAVQNQLDKMFKGSLLKEQPNFNNMFDSIKSIIEKLDTSNIGTKIDTTNSHLSTIKQDLGEIKTKLDLPKETKTCPNPLLNNNSSTPPSSNDFGVPYGTYIPGGVTGW